MVTFEVKLQYYLNNLFSKHCQTKYSKISLRTFYYVYISTVFPLNTLCTQYYYLGDLNFGKIAQKCVFLKHFDDTSFQVYQVVTYQCWLLNGVKLLYHFMLKVIKPGVSHIGEKSAKDGQMSMSKLGRKGFQYYRNSAT